MVALLLAVVIAAALVTFGSLLVRRPRRDDEVERFHRARRLTTGWAQTGAPPPVFAEELLEQETEAERVNA